MKIACDDLKSDINNMKKNNDLLLKDVIYLTKEYKTSEKLCINVSKELLKEDPKFTTAQLLEKIKETPATISESQINTSIKKLGIKKIKALANDTDIDDVLHL
jgi:hypothetical protein